MKSGKRHCCKHESIENDPTNSDRITVCTSFRTDVYSVSRKSIATSKHASSAKSVKQRKQHEPTS